MSGQGIQTGVLKPDTITRWDRFLAFGQKHSLTITIVGLAVVLAGAGMLASTATLSVKESFIDEDGTVFEAYGNGSLATQAGGGMGIGLAALGLGVGAVALRRLGVKQRGWRRAATGLLLAATFFGAYCAFILVLERTATGGGLALPNKPGVYQKTDYAIYDDDTAFKAINAAASLVLIGGAAGTGFGIVSHFAAKKALKIRVNRLEPSAIHSQSVQGKYD